MSKYARNLSGLSIAQKGLLLVLIPLLFQLAFLSSLFYLRHRAETIAAEERHSKLVVATTNEAGRLQILYMQGLFLYFLTHAGIHNQRSDRASAELTILLHQLQQLAQGDAVQERNVAAFKAETERLTAVGKRLADNTDEIPGLIKSKTVADLLIHNTLSKSESEIVEYEQRYSETFATQETNQLIDTLLVLGIVGSITVSVILAASVKRDLANHLDQIMRNIAAIGQNQEPTAALPGDDELAKLDQFVVDTSAEISRARLRERALIDKSKDVICSLSSNLDFARVSKSAEKRWGVSDEDLQGKPLSFIVHADDFNRVRETLERCMNEKDSETNFEHRLLPQLFPQCRWMRWTAVWSAIDSSFFCVSRDVTAEKEVEQLRRDLSNMIAHDLRTPLQSATFFLESLMQQGVGSKQTTSSLAKAQRVHSSIATMSQLLNQMMEIEKIDAQGIELNLKELPLDSIIFDALSAVEQLALSRDVKIVIETQDEPIVKADELRLNQVLQNLLNNAIKFSPENSVVTVKARSVDSSAEIRVIDSGPGIPADQSELVFERFHQVGAQGKGFGLGLAICKRLVVAHGGTIAVEPSDRGCTICFCLPSLNLKHTQENID